MVITSLENDKVKELTKLQQKKYRDLTGTYLVEGEHLVEEAYKNGVILQVIVLENVSASFDDCDVLAVSYDVMKKISALDTPPTVMAVCKKKEYDEIVGDRIVVLDGVQDPGNLGTIIRSSLAFDVTSIVLSPTCVDLYNSKVLRGTQGMIFQLPILVLDTKEAISKIAHKGITIYGTSVVDGTMVSELSNSEREKFCLIMGNEGSGLTKEIFALCDKNLYIPMSDKVESLNVGVACSILLYEMRRK